MKMQAPANIAHFEFENVKYERDENGHFEVAHPAHVDALLRLGAHIVGPGGETLGDTVPYLDPRDAQIASLQAQLAALQSGATEAPVASDPADIADPVLDATGDTSPPAGGGTDDTDKMAAALALEPKFDDMTRDEMVDWLKEVGVVVPANVSKDNARKAIDEAVADHESGQKD